MPEITRDVQMVQIAYQCDECGEGLMIRKDNVMFTIDPPQFPHKCNKCGFEAILTSSYPAMGYRQIIKSPGI